MVPGNAGTKMARNVISTTKEGRKLGSKRLRGGRKQPGKEVGDKREQEADDDELLVEPNPKMQKTGSTLVTRTTANRNSKLTYVGLKNVNNALHRIKDKEISLGSHIRNGSSYPSTSYQFGEFDDEIPLVAPFGCRTAPT